MLYLDHAATTPMRPEAWKSMEAFRDAFGNPSGVHAVSRTAKNALEEARERAAALLGAARPSEIVFTAGGTEADNLAVTGAALADGRPGPRGRQRGRAQGGARIGRVRRAIGCPGEPGRRRPRGSSIRTTWRLPVTEHTAVVSVMLANNETGALQPVAEIAAAVRCRRSRRAGAHRCGAGLRLATTSTSPRSGST